MRSLDDDEDVKYLSDGHLYISYNTHVEIYAKAFCLENFYQVSISSTFYMSAFLCTTEHLLLYLPPPQTSEKETKRLCKIEDKFETLHQWLRFIYTICGLLSLLFLALTMFFYMTLPELRNFQGVNFINILRTNILYERLFSSFSLVTCK